MADNVTDLTTYARMNFFVYLCLLSTVYHSEEKEILSRTIPPATL